MVKDLNFDINLDYIFIKRYSQIIKNNTKNSLIFI